MKRYAEYKDSGIPWIGEIPKGWALKKISWLFEIVNSGTTPKSESKEYYDGKIPWLNTGDLNDGDICETLKHVNNTALVECSALRLYSANSLVIAMYGATIGKLGITQIELCTNQACCVMSKPKNSDVKFLFFSFMAARQHLISLSLGGGQPNVSQGIIKTLKICMPNIEQQKVIVSYLNAKTAAIDTLITDKQKLIDLLKEKRQAIISEAVTKGLDKNAKMKDSGIEWIGEIPEGWEVIPLKRLSILITDGTHQTPEYVDEGIPFISIKDVSSGYLDFSDTKYISYEAHAALSKHAPVEIGDVLFTRIGTLGIAIVVDYGVPFDIFVSLGLIKVDKSQINAQWLVYNMTSPHYFNYIQLVKAGGGTAAAKFNLESVANSHITMPTLSEQKLIVDYLDTQTTRFGSLISDIQTQIEKLKEYRQSIISEAVTGKVAI